VEVPVVGQERVTETVPVPVVGKEA